jgi:hypothetical protein
MEEVDVEKPRQLQAEDGRDANPVSKNDSKKRHLDELLDDALRESFPASDPTSISMR